MRVHSRVQRLERAVAAQPGPRVQWYPTNPDTLAWSRRFRDHDPANAALWKEIRAWGAEHRRDYIYADRGEDFPAGDMMKALYYPVVHIVDPAKWTPQYQRAGTEQAPGFLRRLTNAAYQYQQETGDAYPASAMDLPHLDKLARPPRAESFHEYVLFYCDMAEKRMADPEHPLVLAWHKYLIDHDLGHRVR